MSDIGILRFKLNPKRQKQVLPSLLSIRNIESKRSPQSKVQGSVSSRDLNTICTTSAGILKVFRENLDLIVTIIWVKVKRHLKYRHGWSLSSASAALTILQRLGYHPVTSQVPPSVNVECTTVPSVPRVSWGTWLGYQRPTLLIARHTVFYHAA